MPWRADRIGELLQQEISRAVASKLRDPRLQGLVTVTHVAVTADLQHATVAVSVMGSPEGRRDALKGLEAASGFLRRELAGRLNLKRVPSLKFELDESLEESERILALLALAGTEERDDVG